jgi:hypothetical protein
MPSDCCNWTACTAIAKPRSQGRAWCMGRCWKEFLMKRRAGGCSGDRNGCRFHFRWVIISHLSPLFVAGRGGQTKYVGKPNYVVSILVSQGMSIHVKTCARSWRLHVRTYFDNLAACRRSSVGLAYPSWDRGRALGIRTEEGLRESSVMWALWLTRSVEFPHINLKQWQQGTCSS